MEKRWLEKPEYSGSNPEAPARLPMPSCEACGSKHDGSFGVGRFCNFSCVGKFSQTHPGHKNDLSTQDYDKKYAYNVRKNRVAKAILWDIVPWDKKRGFSSTISEKD